jgi:hypothetical protein
LEFLLLRQDEAKLKKALEAVRNPGSSIVELFRARMDLEALSAAVPTNDYFRILKNNILRIEEGRDWTPGWIAKKLTSYRSDLGYDYFQSEMPLIQQAQVDAVGLSITDERQLTPALVWARTIKDTFPDTLVLLGGNLMGQFQLRGTFLRSGAEILFSSGVDAIVYAEGFLPILEISRTGNPRKASGTIWQGESKNLHINPRTTQPVSWNVLPSPDFRSAETPGGARLWTPYEVHPFYPASNCPHDCGHCGIAACSDTFGHRIRQMSTEQLASCLENSLRTGVSRFDFCGESMSVNYQIALGKVLANRGWTNAIWSVMSNPELSLVSLEKCRALYQAGCRVIQYGPETVSRRTLEILHKLGNEPQKFDTIEENLGLAGVQRHDFLIYGTPGGRLTDDLATLAWMAHYNHETCSAGRWRFVGSSRYGLTILNSPDLKDMPWLRVPEDRLPPIAFDPVRDTKIFSANLPFGYKSRDPEEVSSMKQVDALGVLFQEVRNRHPLKAVTDTLPYPAVRMNYSIQELAAMARELGEVLPSRKPDPNLKWAIRKISHALKGVFPPDASLEQVLAYGESFL